MSERSVVWLAIVFGFAALAAALTFSLSPGIEAEQTACGSHLSDVAFELVVSPLEASALFNRKADDPAACRQASIVAMQGTSAHDLLFFIPAYALFLLFSLWAVRMRAGSPSPWPPATLAALIALADVAETSHMLSILGRDFIAIDNDVSLLIVATRIKWFALLAAALWASWTAWNSAPRNWLLAASCLPALFLVPLMFVEPARFGEPGALSIAFSWLALLGTCFWHAFRSQSAATAAN